MKAPAFAGIPESEYANTRVQPAFGGIPESEYLVTETAGSASPTFNGIPETRGLKKAPPAPTISDRVSAAPKDFTAGVVDLFGLIPAGIENLSTRARGLRTKQYTPEDLPITDRGRVQGTAAGEFLKPKVEDRHTVAERLVDTDLIKGIGDQAREAGEAFQGTAEGIRESLPESIRRSRGESIADSDGVNTRALIDKALGTIAGSLAYGGAIAKVGKAMGGTPISYGAANSAVIASDTFQDAKERAYQNLLEEGIDADTARVAADEAGLRAASVMAPIALVTGRAGEGAASAVSGNFIKRAFEGAKKGALPELPEEIAQQVSTALVAGDDVTANELLETAILAPVAGATHGGVVGALSGKENTKKPKPIKPAETLNTYEANELNNETDASTYTNRKPSELFSDPPETERRLDPERSDRGERRALQTPEDFLSQRHREKVTKHNLTPEQAEAFAPQVEKDPTTGYYTKRELEPVIERAQNHAQVTGEHTLYIESDISNMAGGNAVLGTRQFDQQFYKPVAGMIVEELRKIPGVDVIPVRKGGDENGFIVANADPAAVTQTMDRVVGLVETKARELGLSDVPHTKNPNLKGISLYYGISDIKPGDTVDNILSTADQLVETNKKRRAQNVDRSEIEAARPVASTGRPEGVGRGARENDRGEPEAGADTGLRADAPATGNEVDVNRSNSTTKTASVIEPAGISETVDRDRTERTASAKNVKSTHEPVRPSGRASGRPQDIPPAAAELIADLETGQEQKTPSKEGVPVSETPKSNIDAAAHEAATSPKNSIPAPTEAQREAGNYKKGHARIKGLDVSIENPADSKRRPEWPALKHHYGYIKGTVGKDKDHIDVFVAPKADDNSKSVFVIDQTNEKGAFDEHKVMLGFDSESEARKGYLANYAKGWKGLGGITEMSQDEFKQWLKSDTTKPAGNLKPEQQAAQVDSTQGKTVPSEGKPDSKRGQVFYSKSSVIPGDKKALGLRPDFVQKVVDDFIRGIDSPIEVIVHNTQKAATGRDSITDEQGKEIRLKGTILRGKVNLIAENLNGKSDIESTLRHEIFGHYGFSLFDKKTRDDIERRINDTRDNPKFKKDWNYILEHYDDGSASVQAQEFFARFAEKPENRMTRFYHEILALIQSTLRKLGWLNGNITYSELKSLLSAAERNARGSDVSEAQPAHSQIKRPIRTSGLTGRAANPISSFSKIDKLKAHKDYTAAKAGDVKAAERLVRDLVPHENYERAKRSFGKSAIYLAVHAQEATGKNKIPGMLADAYAAVAGGSVDTEIIQSNISFHTGAKPMERLLFRPVFAGQVISGGRYVIVDDVTTMGGTLAELAHYIRSNGGEIAGSVLLANASRTITMTPSPKRVEEIERRYGNEIRQLFGVDPAGLTAAEAQYLIGFNDADELRNRAAKARQERRERLRSKGIQEESSDLKSQTRISKQTPSKEGVFNSAVQKITDTKAFKKWFGDSSVTVDGEPGSEPLVVYHGTNQDFNAFDPDKIGSNYGVDATGFFFSTDQKEAQYAGSNISSSGTNIMPVYLSIQDPYIDEVNGDSTAYLDEHKAEIIIAAQERRADGIIIKSKNKNKSTYVVFEPTQIKSAIGNRGTFDSADPNILFSREKIPDNKTLDSALRKAGIRKNKLNIAGRVRNYLSLGWDNAKADMAYAADVAAQGSFDRFHGIKRAETTVRGMLPAEQSGYVAARLSTGIDSVMRAVLNYGAPRWKDGIIQKIDGSKGLLEVLDGVKDDLDAWTGWMIGRRAKRLMSEGRENNFNESEIEELLALSRGKEAQFQKVADEYTNFKKAVLDLAEKAGLINPETRHVWDTGDYVPFYRVAVEEAVGPRGKKGLSGQTSGIRTLKGGENVLDDPLENIILNFSHLIDASMKNHALRQTLVNLNNTDYIERLPPTFGKALIPMSQVKRVLKDVGVEIGTIDPDIFNGVRSMMSFKAPTDKDVVRVMDGGKAKYFRVHDPMLLRSLTSVSDPGLNNLVIKALRLPKRILTASVTASPDFMIRNFIRDAVASWVISEDSFRLGVDSFRGAWQTLRDGEGTIDMMFSGASFLSGYVDATDPGKTAKSIRRALRLKGFSAAARNEFISTLVDTPFTLWEKYRDVGDALENASREAVYDAAIKAGKSKAEAVFAAKDLMDFSMQGEWGAVQVFNSMIPFLNARMQGLYKLGRAGAIPLPGVARKHAMQRGIAIALLSVALYALNRDDDRYEELPDWDKDLFWHFFIFDQHFRVPKPFEVGVIFGTIPERAARLMVGADDAEKTFDRLLWNLKEVFAFNPVPQALTPALESYANKNAFTGLDIDSIGDEGRLPADRYNEHTSDTMRALGSLISNETGLSPKKLEHLLTGYLGTLGTYALNVSDLLVRVATGAPDKPSIRADQIPVIKSFYRVDPAFSTRYQQEFYEMYRVANQAAKSINQYREFGDLEKARSILMEYEDELRARASLNNIQKQVSNINKKIDAAYTHPTLRRAEKRKLVDDLLVKKNTYFKRAMDSVNRLPTGKTATENQ